MKLLTDTTRVDNEPMDLTISSQHHSLEEQEEKPNGMILGNQRVSNPATRKDLGRTGG